MRLTMIILLFGLASAAFGQGALDTYDREATKEEEYGAPDISKEEMETWPMHPDKEQKPPKRIEQEELQREEEMYRQDEEELIEEDGLFEDDDQLIPQER